MESTTLATVITADIFTDLLDQIMLIVPTIVGGSVLFIGFRKVYGWAMSKIKRV